MKKPLSPFKFIYLKDPNDPNHTVTAVGVKKLTDTYAVQIARCHAPDHFCKKIARSIIEGRYRKHGAYKEYPIAAFPKAQDLYEQIDFDFNPQTGNEFAIISFPLED